MATAAEEVLPLDRAPCAVHHSMEWGVAAGAKAPDRSIVKTERDALPVG